MFDSRQGSARIDSSPMLVLRVGNGFVAPLLSLIGGAYFGGTVDLVGSDPSHRLFKSYCAP